MRTKPWNYLFVLGVLLLLTVCCSKNEEEIDDFSGNFGTFIDSRDNHVYKWVRIGDQIWMAENLAFKTDTCSFVYYNIGDKYGRLYTWEAANAACPIGWHLPSDNEWEQLAQFVSDENGGYNLSNDDWFSVGKHLKATSGWNNNGNGTDNYGFLALPGGQRAYNSLSNCDTFWDSESCYDIGQSGFWWSSNESSNTKAWTRILSYNYNSFYRESSLKGMGISVRCVKDSVRTEAE